MPVFRFRRGVSPPRTFVAPVAPVALVRSRRPVPARHAVAFALALVAGTASAHPALAGSTPKNGEVLTPAPRRLVLRFSEPVEAAFTRVEMSDPSGAAVGTTPSRSAADDDRSFAVDLPALKPGAYSARWSALGADGHRTRGTIAFTVK